MKTIVKCCLLLIIMGGISGTVHPIFDYDKAVYAGQQEQWEQAYSGLKSLLIDRSDDPSVLYDLGVVSYKMEDYEHAQSYFNAAADKSISSNELKERAYFNAGNAAVKQKKLDDAIHSYEQVLAINPGNERAKHNLDLVRKMREQQKQQQDDQKNKDQKKDDKQQNGQQQDQEKNDQKNDQQQNDQSKNGQDQEDQNQDSGDQSDESGDPKDGNQKKDQQNNKQQGQQQQNEKDKGACEQQKSDAQEKGEEGQSEDQERDSQRKQDEQTDQSKEERREQSEQKNEQKKDGLKDEQREAQEERTPMGVEQAERDSFGKVEAWLADVLKNREKADAALNKQMIRTTVEKQLVGQNGQNCW